MAGRILLDDGNRLFDNNGNPISGGLVRAYEAGTSTPATLYTTSALSTAHANPVVANAAGFVAQMWADEANTYDIKVYAAADVTFTTPLREFLNVKPLTSLTDQRNPLVADYTGVVDATTAFQAKVDASEADANRSINIREGAYLLTSAITCNQGTAILGNGSQGSTPGYGTSFDINHAGNGFVWDGNGLSAKGTGGGLRNVVMTKRTGRNGGAAVKLLATDDNHRPGEMWFHNVLSYGSGTGTWEYGFLLDGSACTTAGSIGIRHVYLQKVRMADNTVKAFKIMNASHLFAFGLAVEMGGGTDDNMDFSLKNENVMLYGVECTGSVTIAANPVGANPVDQTNYLRHFHFSGRLGGTFTNNDTLTAGTVCCTFEGAVVLVNKSKFLKCVTNINPDFLLRRTSVDANQTGNAVAEIVTFEDAYRDRGNNLTEPTTTYTAKCAGTHLFIATVTFAGVEATHTNGELSLVRTLAAGGTVTFTAVENLANKRDANNNATMQLVHLIEMEYDDTIHVVANIGPAGSPQTVDIYGHATTIFTSLSGKYLP